MWRHQYTGYWTSRHRDTRILNQQAWRHQDPGPANSRILDQQIHRYRIPYQQTQGYRIPDQQTRGFRIPDQQTRRFRFPNQQTAELGAGLVYVDTGYRIAGDTEFCDSGLGDMDTVQWFRISRCRHMFFGLADTGYRNNR